MDTFKILIEGYAYTGDNGNIFASPTTTLIYSNGLKVLVDPGTNKEKLLETLKSEKLEPKDIDILFLTHYHPDHFLNIRVFPDTDLYDGGIIWKNDEEIEYKGRIPGTNIDVIPTPGHTGEHASLLIETQDLGRVCLAQDVFWWMDGNQSVQSYDKLINLEDPFASDPDSQQESRKKVLDLADWIVPGHGKMFKNLFKK